MEKSIEETNEKTIKKPRADVKKKVEALEEKVENLSNEIIEDRKASKREFNKTVKKHDKEIKDLIEEFNNAVLNYKYSWIKSMESIDRCVARNSRQILFKGKENFQIAFNYLSDIFYPALGCCPACSSGVCKHFYIRCKSGQIYSTSA